MSEITIGSRLEKERELHNKIKAMDDALQEQREKVRAAEDSIIELIKKHRNDLEQLRINQLLYFLFSIFYFLFSIFYFYFIYVFEQ